jgi:soluble lytic murein transglycosylase-like protein
MRAFSFSTAVLVSFICWHPASAENLPPLFLQAATAHDVPLEWTQAIARVESGGSPFALNIEGKGYFFQSKDEALAKAQQALAEGRSFDSGVMQVNSQWLRKYNIPLEAALDPAANVWLGSWILKQEIERHGRTWSAVAHYHSPDPARGQRYVELVRAAIERGPIKKKRSPQAPAPDKPQRSTPKLDTKEKKSDSTPLVVHRRTDRQLFARVQEEQGQPETTAFVRRVNR